jgi:predicted deacylase
MPTTVTKSHMAVAQNASGRSLNVPIYTIDSGISGPNVYIQSSIHGSEVQGNVVIYHLIQALKQQTITGSITLVPNCNPVGTNIKAGEYTLGRFDPVNGTNWNRGYYYDEEDVINFADQVQPTDTLEQIKSKFKAHTLDKIQTKSSRPWGLGLAQQLNLKLQAMASQADIVLDLHNGPVSSRHIYVPEFLAQQAKLFSMPHVILIPNHFAGALDEASFCPWWTLQSLLNDRFEDNYDFNVEAYTLEMGSQEVIDFADGQHDANAILAYLQAKGVIEDTQYQPEKISRVGVYLADYKTLFTDFGGMVEYVAKPGECLKQGDTLAKVLNIDDLNNEHATKIISAPCDLIPILHFPSASVLSGTQLYKCFTNYFSIT